MDCKGLHRLRLCYSERTNEPNVFVSATANEAMNQQRLRLCYSERNNEPTTSSSLLQRTNQRINVFVSATANDSTNQRLRLAIADDTTNEPPNECYRVDIERYLYNFSLGVLQPGIRGAMVARLTPDQKVACSIHVGFKKPRNRNPRNLILFCPLFYSPKITVNPVSFFIYNKSV